MLNSVGSCVSNALSYCVFNTVDFCVFNTVGLCVGFFLLNALSFCVFNIRWASVCFKLRAAVRSIMWAADLSRCMFNTVSFCVLLYFFAVS